MFFASLLVAGAAGSVSAQNACSQDLGRDLITMSVVNRTNRPIIVNWVDRLCKEQSSADRTAASKTFFGDTYHGHVFRVREAGSNKLLKEFVVSPNSKTIMVTSLAAAPAPPSASHTRPETGVEKFRKNIVATWVNTNDGGKAVIENNNITWYVNGKLAHRSLYTIANEKTIGFKNPEGLDRTWIVRFEKNNTIMIATRPDNNKFFEFKRVAVTKKAETKKK